MGNQTNNMSELQIVQQCEMLEKALEDDMIYDKSEVYGKELEYESFSSNTCNARMKSC